LDLDKVRILNNSNTLQQTRYSYYREKEVATYAKFVDDYFNSFDIDSTEYDFDHNYYDVSKSKEHLSTVISQSTNAKMANPDIDINSGMIHKVSQYLAALTMYV